MLGRFGEVPIGFYTGSADISIPIYTIKEDGIEIPITLHYHSSGVKVEDQATNVGLGWSLEPSWSIIQVVNGHEDHLDHLLDGDTAGYIELKSGPLALQDVYYGRPEYGSNVWPCMAPYDTSGDHSYTINRLLQGDGQPDIYIYNFAGYSGKFYVNPETGQPVMLDKKSSITFTGGFQGWQATTLDGNIFYFNVYESSSTYIIGDNTGYTFKLTGIRLANGKFIGFNYADGFYGWYVYREEYHSGYPYSVDPNYGTVPHSDFSKHNVKNLVSITSSEAIVNFNLDDRLDLPAAPDSDGIPNNGVLSTKRVKSIDIISTETGKKIKTFILSQSYFPYCNTGGSYLDTTGKSSVLGMRLRLDSVQEIGYATNGSTTSRPPYTFGYNTTLLPFKTSFARDFWGYYNGQGNTGLMPDLSWFYYNFDPTYSIVPSYYLDSAYVNGNRTPDTSKMQAGMLKRITYPTGGFTEFDYSAHTFGNYNYPDQAKVNSLFKQVAVVDRNLPTSDSTNKIFYLQRTTILSISSRISKGAPLQGLTFSSLKPSSITLLKMTGQYNVAVLKTWQMADTDSVTFNANGGEMRWSENFTVNYDPSPNTRYIIEVSLPDNLGPQNTASNNASVQSTVSFYDTAMVPQLSRGGGLCITGIRNYASTGNLVGTKSIRYVNNDSTTSGLLMSPLKYFYSNDIYFIHPTNAQTADHPTVQEGRATVLFGSSESAIPYSDGAGGNFVGYSRVEERDWGPTGSTNGIHVYHYNNSPSEIQVNCPDNPKLDNGLISGDETLTAAGDTVIDNTYNYSIKNYTFFKGVKIFTNYIGPEACDLMTAPDQDPANWAYWPIGHRYNIMFYPLRSIWYLRQQKTTRQHAGAQTLATTETYDYNALGQPSFTTNYTSKGKKQTSHIIYPVDSASLPGSIVQKLKDKGLFEYPLTKIETINDTEVARTNINYMDIGQLVRSNIQQSHLRHPLYTKTTFDSYGSNKTLLQFTDLGTTTSLLWSDNNRRVIANVLNGYQTDIAYTSFETDGTGQWTVPSPLRDTVHSITGRRSYQLSNGAITDTMGLSASQCYIVSYWTQNQAPITITGTMAGYPTEGKTINGWTLYVHKVTGQTVISVSGSGLIDELRLYPAKAQMTSYTFEPLVGMASTCDVGNRITYYEYDGLQRLKRVRDQDYNIIKSIDYQYQGNSGCGANCYILTMQTFAGTNTLGYPVGVFNVHGKLLGNAAGPPQYVTLWNNDTADSRIGTLSAGGDSLHFNMTLNSGQTLPGAVTGCRYYQVDLAWNQIDGVRNFNGCYVDFGDGTGMRLGANLPDTLRNLAPNTVQVGSAAPWFNYYALYLIHSYPDTLLKTLTFYHNDGEETEDFDNVNNPATSLAHLSHLRGNLPSNTNRFGGSSYQQPSMLSVDSIWNWSSIHSIRNFRLNTGDGGVTNILHLHYAQDFMAGNPNLDTIMFGRNNLECYFDSSFKISRLKSDWNTYFKHLKWMVLSDRQWNREDLSALTELKELSVFSARQHPTNNPTNNPYIPLPTQVADSIFNQMARGAGQYCTNGFLYVGDGGTTRSSASDASVAFLLSKGWTLYLNGQQITAY
ncbi:MAG: hypothetical protein BGO55_03925 [Sphingobacteriales bacterium 50-39]|nr:MAG: hypothetical protein BGO55_03925 [Sphingobacteriales bacterium 50-39]